MKKSFLTNFNVANHEALELVKCEPGKDIKGGVWTDIQGIRTLDSDNIGFVEYFDGENILMTKYSHNLLVGATGKGKSYVYIMNQLELLSRLPDDKKPSFIVTDTSKGMIYRNLCGVLEARNYKIKIFDFSRPYRSNPFNPLQTIYENYHRYLNISYLISKNKVGRTFDGRKYSTLREAAEAAREERNRLISKVSKLVQDFATVLIPSTDPKDASWVSGARNFCTGVIWMMLLESAEPNTRMTVDNFTISNLARLVFHNDNDYRDLLTLLERYKSDLSVQQAINIVGMNAKVTRDGYTASMTSKLGEYLTENILAMTASDRESDIISTVHSDEPYAIFIVTDESCNCTNSICSMLIDQLLGELTDICKKRNENALDRDVLILADEFCNMPKMPNFVNQITTLRSRRIYMMLALQSMHQLDMVYGEDVRKTIEINCDTQPFLGSNNYETNEAFVKNMGSTIGTETTANTDNRGELSVHQSSVDVSLIRMSDLAALQLGEFYVKRNPQRLKTYMLPYFKRTDVPPAIPLESVPFRDYISSMYVYDIEKSLDEARALSKSTKTDFDWF